MLSPVGSISASSKGHFIILLGRLFQDENIMIPENPVSMSPMLYFICYKMGFFVRSSVVWNPMKVSKAFCRPTDGTFSRTMGCRKDKTTSSMAVFSGENKELLLQWWKWSSVMNLLPGGGLVPPRNDAISGAQCWPLLLAGRVVSHGYSQIGLCEWKCMLLSSCKSLISAFMIIVFMSQLNNYGYKRIGKDHMVFVFHRVAYFT